MSDVTTGSAFNPQFFMNPPWWLGRVEAKETWNDNIAGETFTNVADIKGWGHRYKVRIFNWHTGDLDKLPPKDMAFCQVVMPVTAGSGHGGSSQTPSIESGSIVFGFFMDGMAGQEGYIMGLLGNSNNNVPKERGQPAPNQQGSPQPPPPGSPPGTRPTPAPLPPTPPTGPGSLANVPVPPKVDQLSSAQLIKLLDPSKTPSSAVFKAASEAREKARSSGLSAAEVERQALIATVKASRQPGAAAGSTGNCNQGYQQFNNTYTDGDPMRAAKVPDDRIVAKTPLSTTEAQHIETEAKTEQDKDSKKRVSLSDVCKKGNSDTKGVQRVLKNLLTAVEELKKKYNQVSAFATEAQEFSQQVQEKVFYAIEEMSSFIKNILQGVRGYVLKTLSDQVKKISPNLFPSENVELDEKTEKGLTLINCLFNRITSGLKSLLANILSGLLDNLINAPLCAVESMLGDLLDKILGPITATLQSIFNSFNSLLSGITGFLSQGLDIIGGAVGSLFDALEFVQGIIQFFSCDESQDCIEYNEISQDRSALSGGDATTSNNTQSTPTGTGSNASQPVAANVIKNTSNLNVGESNVETKLAAAEENKLVRDSLQLF
jgi:hypothetical protein